jgi:hypothetical protein
MGCNLFTDEFISTVQSIQTGTPAPTKVAQAQTASTSTSIPAPTQTRTIPTIQPTVQINEPVGCQRPPDDYTRLIINGEKLNYRTVWMLKHAQQLYGGPIDFAGKAITQGSYNPGGVAASFGTHDGGGAVDIAVKDLRTGAVLRNELPSAIRALRITGFAAWVREPDELYQGSPIHIHAIAIGDAELSTAAKDQLTGTFGYFLGYNGLPQTNNIPIADRHGGPILCKWMRDMGYRDMR